MTLTPFHTFEYAEEVAPNEAPAAFSGVPSLEWNSIDDEEPAAAQAPVGTVATIERDAISYRCSLVLVDHDGGHLHSLEVTFNERVISEQRSVLVGSDESGSFRIKLRADRPLKRPRLSMQFRPGPNHTPAELLPAVTLLEAAGPSLSVGLLSHNTGRWATEPVPIPDDHPLLPAGFAAAVRVLALIQERTGQDFPMPREVTDEDAQSIRRANALLTNGVIAGTWTSATVSLDSEGLEVIDAATAEHGALFEFISDYELAIGNWHVTIGPVRYRLEQVHLTESAIGEGSDSGTVTLIAGSNNRFELRLVESSRVSGTEAGFGSGDELNRYAGRWVAQLGEEVVEVGDSPEEVVAALRRSGREGAIWRVPTSKAEAEATVGGTI